MDGVKRVAYSGCSITSDTISCACSGVDGPPGEPLGARLSEDFSKHEHPGAGSLDLERDADNTSRLTMRRENASNALMFDAQQNIKGRPPTDLPVEGISLMQ